MARTSLRRCAPSCLMLALPAAAASRRRPARPRRVGRARSRPAGGCSTISPSIIAARSGRPDRQRQPNMTKCANSPPRSAQRLARLPANPAQGAAGRRRRRAAAGDRRARPRRPRSTAGARALADRLLAAYPVPLAPAARPDLARGAALYAENCASCHGANGEGPTRRRQARPAADRLHRPRPRPRAQPVRPLPGDRPGPRRHGDAELRHRCPRGPLGAGLPRRQFAYPAALPAEGERLWRDDPASARPIPDLAALVALTPGRRSTRRSARTRRRRSSPICAPIPMRCAAERPASLQLARAELCARASPPMRAGDRDAAPSELALAAYLDGFEPVEALLAARDGGLVAEVERAMGGLRAAIGRGAPADDVAQRLSGPKRLFDRGRSRARAGSGERRFHLPRRLRHPAARRAGGAADRDRDDHLPAQGRAPRSAALCPWRLGRRAGRRRRHLVAATTYHRISGAEPRADRRLRLAAGGGRSCCSSASGCTARRRRAHGSATSSEKLQGALTRGSAWLLFALAFIAVYREVFETIIFYAALGRAGNGAAMLAGALAGAWRCWRSIAWAMLRFSRKLPIAKFFQYSAALIAVLAVVLAGKGVAALQEAGHARRHPARRLPAQPDARPLPDRSRRSPPRLVMLLAARHRLPLRAQAVATPHPLPAE